MKILFIGHAINSKDTNHAGVSIAGNKMQLGLVKALKLKYEDDLSIFTQFPIAVYPKEKKIFIKNDEIELSTGVKAKKVPFINIFILKQFTKIISTLIMIIKWSIVNRKDKKYIICYNAFPDIATPILWTKKIFRIKTICLLADLPISNVIKYKGLIRTIARKFEERASWRNIDKFDGLAVLNENAIYEHSLTSNFIVIDGGFDKEDLPIYETKKKGKKENYIKVIFSGTLIEYNGIVNLIEAAKLLEHHNFTLEIYGEGPLTEYVKKESSQCNKIKYMGYVSHQEILEIQKNATLLVSPLLPEHPVAKVAFPSKIVEYLMSGTPVVSTKVNGLTYGYLENMFIFNNETPEEMAKTFEYIFELNEKELNSISNQARKFIIQNKTWEIQVEKFNKFFIKD